MQRSILFDSFFLGGFECSTHRRADGRRLDLLESTGHARHAAQDYARLAALGIRTMRDGLRWHLIEYAPGRYDFTSLEEMLDAAASTGVQVIWDLCHYGCPDHLDIWRPGFVEAFAAYAEAAARVIARRQPVPWLCPINEISYWAWAGADHARMYPHATGRGLELKHQLVRASMAAVRRVRQAVPQARFVAIDPVIGVHPVDPALAEEARGYERAAHDGWKLMTGDLWPGLGGTPDLLDVVGVNHYVASQWEIGGEIPNLTVPLGDPRRHPLHELLREVHAEFGRPVFIAETGAEGDDRVTWFEYVCDEVAIALAQGVPVQGICLYPVLDYPGWDNDRHCETGLLGPADPAGRRVLHDDFAAALARQQARFARLFAGSPLAVA